MKKRFIFIFFIIIVVFCLTACEDKDLNSDIADVQQTGKSAEKPSVVLILSERKL